MTPRELAEAARTEHQHGYRPITKGRLLLACADALIAQAELLEKYRKTHEDAEGFACVEVDGVDHSCVLCRAYDALNEEKP